MKENIRVVVANSGQARIFRFNGLKEPLTETDDLINPEARIHERELNSDRPGDLSDAMGRGKHAGDPQSGTREQRQIEFVRLVSRRLDASLSRNEFDSVILIAPPVFLGLLRKHLATSVRDRVKREIKKDVIRFSEQEIREYLKP